MADPVDLAMGEIREDEDQVYRSLFGSGAGWGKLDLERDYFIGKLPAHRVASADSPATLTVGNTRGDYKVSEYGSRGQDAIQAASDALTSGGTIVLLDKIECTDATHAVGAGQYAAVALGDYVDLYGELEWADGATFTHQSANVNYLLCPGLFSRINGRLWGHGNYTCPINGVDTVAAAGTNTLGGGLVLTKQRLNIGTLHVEGFAEHGVAINGPGSNPLAFQIGTMRIKACGGTGLSVHAWATDGEIDKVWIGSCGRNLDLLNSECAIGILHTWGSASYGIVFDTGSDGTRIGTAYVETNAIFGIFYNGTHRTQIGSLELWANGLAGNGGGIKLTNSTRNLIGGGKARNNIGVLAELQGASFGNDFNLDQIDTYAATDDGTAAVTHAATVGAGSQTVTFTDSPLDTSSPSKHLHCWLVIPGAGAAGATLTSARITAVADANTCTIDTPASTAVTGAAAVIHATHDGIWEATSSTALETASTPNTYRGSIQVRQILGQQMFINPTSQALNVAGVNPRGTQVFTSSGATVGPDWRKYDTLDQKLTSSPTITFFGSSPILTGQEVTIILRQDSTGGRTVTWPATVKLAGGSLTLSAAANAVDIVRFRYDGTNWNEFARSLAIA